MHNKLYIYMRQNLINQHPFFTSFVVVWCFLISLVTAAISDWMGVIWRMPRMLFHPFIPGRGLLSHSSPYYSVGVCVQVGADLSGYRVTHGPHHRRGLWKVHTGAWPPARALKCDSWREYSPAATAVRPRESRSSAIAVSRTRCVCYVHQPFFHD